MNKRHELLKVALVQRAAEATPGNNLEANVAAIREASQYGAALVLLEELHNTRYFCQTEDVKNFNLAETIPGPTSERLSQAAKESGIVIVASLFEKRATGIYHNSAVVFDSDGSLAGRYRKMHIPDDPGFHEKFYFTPGDHDKNSGFQPIDTTVGRLGVLVCWDQWYPEAARLMALAGADLLLYPTAIGWDSRDEDAEKARQLDAWITIQRSHAIANGIPLLCCNRCGHEPDPDKLSPGIEFWGNSFIAGPQGEILAQCNTADQIVYAEIDLDRSENIRQIWPFFRDRRIDAYKNITKRLID